jgi:pimeloyl-ACP methyl ester carboxylesterase/ketosteroid isomerase-like protein
MPIASLLTLVALAAGVAPDAASNAREGTVPSSDGVPIRYRVMGQGRPALVFVHCWTCDQHFWDASLDRFTRDYTVVTLDLAGHGASGRDRKQWTIAAFADDVKAVVEKLGLERVVLVGHSMGGPVALEAARAMPQRVVALVPVDTLVNVEERPTPEQVDGFLAAFRADYKATAEKFVREYMFVPASPREAIERVVRQATSAPPDVAVAALDAAWRHDARAGFRELKAPIRALNGTRFPTNVEANRRYAPQFDAVIMPDVGHYPMLEAPARFADLLAGILKDIAPPEAGARADAPAGTAPPAADAPRPLLITVDDLPIGGEHPTREDRAAITRGLLDALARHKIRAVALVIWDHVQPDDRPLLESWLAAGHELGNHSAAHLDYTRTDAETYVADVERGRKGLAEFLKPHGATPRFFRFPYLNEGETEAKLDAMRRYLDSSGQRNLPVTIDDQDWSFDRPWTEAARAGDAKAREAIAADYLAALRIEVRDQEATGDRLFGRRVPQVLLLHANAVGAAQWDALFTWLEESGHRFAAADEVLADPAFAEPHRYLSRYGSGLWARIDAERGAREAREEVIAMLRRQSEDWNRGDLTAFCSVYADDATFLGTTGVFQGKEAILERYRKRYGTDPASMGTLSFDIIEARPAAGTEVSLLGDAVPGGVHSVSVAARWHLRYADKPEASGLTLVVLRRQGKNWMIVQDASM